MKPAVLAAAVGALLLGVGEARAYETFWTPWSRHKCELPYGGVVYTKTAESCAEYCAAVKEAREREQQRAEAAAARQSEERKRLRQYDDARKAEWDLCMRRESASRCGPPPTALEGFAR
jgi:hypothetical protein